DTTSNTFRLLRRAYDHFSLFMDYIRDIEFTSQSNIAASIPAIKNRYETWLSEMDAGETWQSVKPPSPPRRVEVLGDCTWRYLAMNGFFEEAKRRKVYQVAAAYIIAAAGVIQLASAAFPAWELANWALRLVTVLLRRR